MHTCEQTGARACAPPLTRRHLLRSVAPLAAGLAVAPALATHAQATPLSPIDARLVALADAHAAVEAACNAFTAKRRRMNRAASMALDDEFGDMVARFGPIEAEMAETPADGLAGILAKARTCCCPTEPDQDVFNSLAADVWRILGGAAA